MPRRTIWLTDDHDRRLQDLADRWGLSFSGTVARLLDAQLVGLIEIDRAERELGHAGQA